MAIPVLYLYRLPETSSMPAGQTTIHGKSLTVWQVPVVESSSMDCSFEQVVDRLACLPRMFVEPDGSFVWRGSIDADAAYQNLTPSGHRSTTWQLDGMLYDRAGRVLRVELQGTCPRSAWLQLLECLQPPQELVAYLVEYGCFVLASDLLAIWERNELSGH
jgi:hypothetical protein